MKFDLKKFIGDDQKIDNTKVLTASKIITPTRFVISKDSPLGEPGSTLYSNINYTHDENDGVRKMTAPKTLWDPFVGIYNMFMTPEKHNISNYKK